MKWGLPLLGVAAGCGGGDSGGGTTTQTSGGAPPAAKEPLADAARRLERELPAGSCKELGPLMLHSAPRGADPATPATARECAAIRNETQGVLRGLKVRRSSELGAAGFAEGSGSAPRPGYVVGLVWGLDRDGSWKLLFNAIFRPQIGHPPALGQQADANATRFVAALGRRDCDATWRLLNVASRFVRSSDGEQAGFCRSVAGLYRDPKSAYAQIAAEPGVRPRPLGKTRDIAFYGLQLSNGRYLVLVLAGRLGLEGVPLAEQTQHDNPSVLEFVTVRRASG